MAEPQRPKGSLDHLKKVDPNSDHDTGAPFSLDYQSYEGPSRGRRSLVWPGVMSAIFYLGSIAWLVSMLENRPGHFVEPTESGGLWILCTVIWIIASIVIDKSMSLGWSCTKGVIFAFLLTTGLCGLIASVCGNPFRPIL